jgi:hypothetical protein
MVSEPYCNHLNGIVYIYDLEGKLIGNVTSPYGFESRSPRNFGYTVSASDNLLAVGESSAPACYWMLRNNEPYHPRPEVVNPVCLAD